MALNLFRLSALLGDRDIKYIGAEYTQSGQYLCKKLAALPYAPDIQVEFVHYEAPDLSFIGSFDNVMIFTCHSIEQVHKIPDNYFSIVANVANNVKGAHLEPFGFQRDNSSQRSQEQERMFHEKLWNINFYECLLRAESAGTLNILDIRQDVFDTQSNNPTSFAVWESSKLK